MNIDWGNLEEGETDSCLQWDGPLDSRTWHYQKRLDSTGQKSQESADLIDGSCGRVPTDKCRTGALTQGQSMM